MGGYSNFANTNNSCSLVNHDQPSRTRVLIDKGTMEDVTQRSRSDRAYNDHKDERDDGDNDSTVSTIDSPLLMSSGHSSPPLSPLHGQQYLLQHSHDDYDQSLVPSVRDMISGIGPSATTINGPLVASGAPTHGSNSSSVVDIALPSATCSVSTAPSTADEASSIGMDSAAGFDYFRLRLDAAAYTGPGTVGVGTAGHRRIPSWETSPHQQPLNISHQHSSSVAGSRSIQHPNSVGIGPEHGGFPPLPPQQLQHIHAQQNSPGWGSQVTRMHHPQHQIQSQQHPQRAAMFRGDHPSVSYRPPSPGARQQHTFPAHVNHHQQQHHWSHHQSPSATHRQVGTSTDSHLAFLPQGGGRGDPRNSLYHRTNTNLVTTANASQYQMHPQQHHNQVTQQRKTSQYSQPTYMSPQANTPTRGARDGGSKVGHNRTDSIGGQSASSNTKTNMSVATNVGSPHRGPQGSHPIAAGNPGGNQTNAPRSSSEVLKTLLRKKACLYEPDTSRAVALVTWLVGRELALEYGYFSRQQLQAGVHACVTSKIDSGVITRTKVNRCMQIILNSCFHYIIPRPDGTEENGDAFRHLFAQEVLNTKSAIDPKELLEMLPEPWRDIQVNQDEVLHASSNADDVISVSKHKETEIVTPSHSPRLDSMRHEEHSPGEKHFSIDGTDGGDTKRAVLLCFNENVRKAEDVFRCHNEFIRDTAHASNLQLSSHEWLQFFGKEAAATPFLWGNIGIPLPNLEEQSISQPDALGVLNKNELATFRTSWCSKRYDHNHELCGFAHAEVNSGWLRRNPFEYSYRCELCPSITTFDKRPGPKSFYILNECENGVNCEYAHSVEEILYHPERYKCSKTCSFTGRAGGCPLGDVCPNFHPIDSYRFPKKSDSRSPRHSRQQQSGGNKTGTGASSSSSVGHSGTPILYASPAPVSSFEQQLLMPGLQSLFRRQCSVVRAHIRTSGYKCSCNYSYFGDDTGIETGVTKPTISSTRQEKYLSSHAATQAVVRPPQAATRM